MLDGSNISFYIHHIDTWDASIQATGSGRNFMKGTITGNVMKFKWVREGRENEPGGEMIRRDRFAILQAPVRARRQRTAIANASADSSRST